MLALYADLLDMFEVPGWVLGVGVVLLLILLGVFFFLRNRRPDDDE